jgi:tRNA-dihydrouridine synthase A
MRTPDLVAEGVAAMKRAVTVPVTVKCRIGVDDQDPRAALWRLTGTVAAAGADAVIVHARKAWLAGLSPKENREVPPLDYPLVHALKADFPTLPVVLNGGLASPEAGLAHLDGRAGTPLDGLMLGRAAYQDPWRLLSVDPLLFGQPAPVASAADAVHAMIPYIEDQLSRGVRLATITRHMTGLFQAVPGARQYRRHLSERATRPGAGVAVLLEALSKVLDARPAVCDTAA